MKKFFQNRALQSVSLRTQKGRNTLLILLAITVFFVGPERYSWNSHNHTELQAHILQNKVKQIEAQIAYINIAKNTPNIQQTIQTIQTALPETSNEVSFINQLVNYANNAGVAWTSASPPSNLIDNPQAIKSKINTTGEGALGTSSGSITSNGLNGAVQYAFAIQISGSISNVNNFIGNLKTLPRAVSVQSLSISWENSTTVKANLAFSIYTWSPAKPGVTINKKSGL